jgi:hypothetical protein
MSCRNHCFTKLIDDARGTVYEQGEEHLSVAILQGDLTKMKRGNPESSATMQSISDKSKPAERRGRKAMDLKAHNRVTTTARPPKKTMH